MHGMQWDSLHTQRLQSVYQKIGTVFIESCNQSLHQNTSQTEIPRYVYLHFRNNERTTTLNPHNDSIWKFPMQLHDIKCSICPHIKLMLCVLRVLQCYEYKGMP